MTNSLSSPVPTTSVTLVETAALSDSVETPAAAFVLTSLIAETIDVLSLVASVSVAPTVVESEAIDALTALISPAIVVTRALICSREGTPAYRGRSFLLQREQRH